MVLGRGIFYGDPEVVMSKRYPAMLDLRDTCRSRCGASAALSDDVTPQSEAIVSEK